MREKSEITVWIFRGPTSSPCKFSSAEELRAWIAARVPRTEILKVCPYINGQRARWAYVMAKNAANWLCDFIDEAERAGF